MLLLSKDVFCIAGFGVVYFFFSICLESGSLSSLAFVCDSWGFLV
jgi:hypothetical protein